MTTVRDLLIDHLSQQIKFHTKQIIEFTKHIEEQKHYRTDYRNMLIWVRNKMKVTE